MNTYGLLFRLGLALIAAASFAGCGSTRGLYDAGGAAVGGVIASELTDGNPIWTAAGAGGGALVAEGLQSASAKSRRTSYNRGYDQGRSDAVKQQYWLMQRAQQGDEEEDILAMQYLTIPAPTEVQTEQGPIKLVPHNNVIPVVK